jgi:hypothetical protein
MNSGMKKGQKEKIEDYRSQLGRFKKKGFVDKSFPIMSPEFLRWYVTKNAR